MSPHEGTGGLGVGAASILTNANPLHFEVIDRPFPTTATAEHRYLSVIHRGECVPLAVDAVFNIFPFLGLKAAS